MSNNTFVIEERYGFNKITPKLFIIDSIKGIIISSNIDGLFVTTEADYVLMSFFFGEKVTSMNFSKKDKILEKLIQDIRIQVFEIIEERNSIALWRI